VLGYYLLREIKDPGYIASVRENELGGRFLKVQGDLHNDFWFYYHNFANERLSDRYFLVPIGLLIGFFSKNKRLQRFTLFVFIMAITFFLVISSAQTRLEQYDAPLFPFLAILIALVVHFIFEQIKNIKQINLRLRTQVLPYLFLFLVFMLPYKKIWDKTYLPGEKYWDAEFYEIGYLLKDAVKGEYDFNFKYLLYDGYNAQNIFYLRVLWNKGVYTGFRYPNEILVNDTIIVCQESMKRYIQEHFISEETFRKGHIVFYKIKGKITHASKSGS